MTTNTYSARRTKCPVCGSDKFLVAYKQTFAPLVGASILDGYDVCVCENCGMVFANNIPSQKEFDDYYANSNKWESVNKDHQVDSYHLVDSKLYNYVLDHVDKNTAIADLGCGSGVDLLHLQKLGFTNLYGVDTSESNCKYLKAGGGINTICGSLFQIGETDFETKFEVILLSQVLEHIVDLQGFLARIKAIVSTASKVIISVPEIDIDGWYRFSNPYEEFNAEHVNFFSYSKLIKLFEKYGFYPIYTSGNNFCRFVVFESNPLDEKLFIQTYVAQSALQITAIASLFDELIASQRKVIVWGASTFARYLWANTKLSELNIVAFVDSNTHIQGKFLGKEINIYSPQYLKKADSDTLVFVATYSTVYDSIRRYAQDELHIELEILFPLSAEFDYSKFKEF